MSRTDTTTSAAIDARLAQASAASGAGRYRDAVRLCNEALALCPPDQAARRAHALAQQARNHARLGDLPAGARCASEALALAETLDDAALLAEALVQLAFVFAQTLMGRDALQCGLRALAAARQAGHAELEGWALNRIGVAYASLDNPAQACDTTQQALEIAQRQGLAELGFSCLNNLAYFWLQRLGEAQRSCNHADADDDAALREARQQARTLAEQACAAGRRSGSPFHVAVAVSNLVDAMLASEEFDPALPLIDEFEALSQSHGYQDLALQAATQRALILKARGRLREALAALEQLLSENGAVLTPKLRRIIIRSLYETRKACEDYREALGYLEQLGELERQVSRDTLTLQTEVTLIRQEVEQARARAEHALRDAQRERERASELEREQQRLRDEAAAWGRAAHEDVLTGLNNRRHAEPALELLVEGARLAGKPIVLAMLDVDHFKRINDELGHATGDLVLQELARLLRKGVRGADLLARVGGEEFLIAIIGIGIEAALEICERLRLSVAQHDWAQIAPGLQVSVSIGLSGGGVPLAAKLLQEHADRALYTAKRAGRNRVSAD